MALKIRIHYGTAIAVTMNDELDYFGQTVNIAARVQATADAQEISLTDEVIAYPGVRGLLVGYPTDRDSAEFRGLGRRMGVVRVGAAATA